METCCTPEPTTPLLPPPRPFPFVPSRNLTPETDCESCFCCCCWLPCFFLACNVFLAFCWRRCACWRTLPPLLLSIFFPSPPGGAAPAEFCWPEGLPRPLPPLFTLPRPLPAPWRFLLSFMMSSVRMRQLLIKSNYLNETYLGKCRSCLEWPYLTHREVRKLSLTYNQSTLYRPV